MCHTFFLHWRPVHMSDQSVYISDQTVYMSDQTVYVSDQTLDSISDPEIKQS